MLTKKILPSAGFIILVATITICVTTVLWTFTPLNYEICNKKLRIGLKLSTAGKKKEAFKYFVEAAPYAPTDVERANLYMYAGAMVTDKDTKYKYYKLSLLANPDTNVLTNTLQTNGILDDVMNTKLD